MACVQSGAKRCGRPTTESKGVWFLFRAPFNIGLLALCHGILHCMLAQPDFYVALLGQIFMGTVYVFFEQSLQEMLLLYAFDDPIKYRDYLSLHYLVFTAGCALGSPLAYGLYELSNFANAFYVTGLCCFLVGVSARVLLSAFVAHNNGHTGWFFAGGKGTCATKCGGHPLTTER
jgi:hypothetical protein